MESENSQIKDLIIKYNLKPHVEGGYAQLLYEDPVVITQNCLPKEYNGSRSLWGAIYYLLPKNSISVLHKLRMSELWNFYLGGPLELFDISPEGNQTVIILGQDISKEQQLAYVFPSGHWIGARPCKDSEFSFVSCVTCPCFTFDDWEKADCDELEKKFPHLKKTFDVFRKS